MVDSEGAVAGIGLVLVALVVVVLAEADSEDFQVVADLAVEEDHQEVGNDAYV